MHPGLWSPTACGVAGPLPKVEIAPIGWKDFDPPGPDQEGEVIVIRNRGSEVVDLSGFTLRDESSVNRYRFRDGVGIGPGTELAVETGCAQDRVNRVFWCLGQPVWNNTGDMAMLLDRDGRVLAHRRY